MPTLKEILIAQYRACYVPEGFFAPLKDALADVTEEQALQKSAGIGNSIYGIVQHLFFCNKRFLQHFIEGSVPPLNISNADTFQRKDNFENWEELRSKAENVFNQWQEAISNCDDSKLDLLTEPDSDLVWGLFLAQLVIHNAYHIGQIVHIRKEQDSWVGNGAWAD